MDAPMIRRNAAAAVRLPSPAKRVVRKRKRVDETSARPELRQNKLARMVGVSKLRGRVSKLGAAARPAEDPKPAERSECKTLDDYTAADSLRDRLLKGRSPEVCLKLMSFHVLMPLPSAPITAPVQPAKGLSARYLSSWVLILEAFTRRGVLQADVAPLCKQTSQAGTGTHYYLGPAETVRQSELTQIGFHFRATAVQSRQAFFEEVPRVRGNIIPELSEMVAQAAKVAELQKEQPAHPLPPNLQDRHLPSHASSRQTPCDLAPGSCCKATT